MILGQRYAHVTLHVPGSHNVSNALAAAAAAYLLGLIGGYPLGAKTAEIAVEKLMNRELIWEPTP